MTTENHTRARTFARLAAFAALAGALALPGCGRKGPLDLPPSPAGEPTLSAAPHMDARGQPIAPPGARKQIPLDALID